ncbi:MAG: ATPase, T2SS/T4P/T4SS family [Pseudomonadota bacterium]|uniref:GspE/PulE family protein n=2 Tax=Burkholderiaceae TaxID=119060 RepID=UPI001484E335|nr:ATPase, T2SS/T4P/T4SS family [Burkholderia sp. 4M9327F10]
MGFAEKLRKGVVPASESFQVTTLEARSSADPGPLPPPPNGLLPHVVYPATRARPFGRVAIDLGLLTAAQVSALLDPKELAKGGRIGDRAIRLGMLTQDQVDAILGVQTITIHVDARHAGNPQFLTWLEDLSRRHVVTKVERVSAQDLESVREAEKAGGVADDTDLVTLTKARRIVVDAAAMGASDIHVLVREKHAEVQLRVKGDLMVAHKLNMRRDEGEALVRSIYTGLATIKEPVYNPLSFQDGQISGDALPGTNVSSVRLIRGPSFPEETGGGFLVARMQYHRHKKEIRATSRTIELSVPARPEGKFAVAGFTPLQIALSEYLVRIPMGVVLVTGPTGSGKTTTLHEYMEDQARLFPHLRQVTIEDPIEYPKDWAVQLSASKDFLDKLHKALRMDPDIILMGEIRKAEEALATLQAAMTGHLVWTTVHVTDPYRTIRRLEMMDHERLSLATLCDHELIVGLMAQRIVQALCGKCCRPLEDQPDALPAYMRDRLKSWAPNGDLGSVRLRGPGCEHCGFHGIVDRQAVAEIVVTDEEFMDDYQHRDVLIARRNHRLKPGSDKSMLANAMDLVFAGKVDPRDVHAKVHKLEFMEEGV